MRRIHTDRKEEYLEILNQLRPIDDDFMRELFRDNIPLTQYVLRLITGIPDLVVISQETQKDIRDLSGSRSLCLDVFASDSSGQKYDIEVQRADIGADSRRARYHSSAIDSEYLHKGQKFSELPNTYVIFITENDIFGAGEDIYPIERINTVTGTPFNDGEHILYANCSNKSNSDVGKMLRDFLCSDPDKMHTELPEEKTRILKNTEKGRIDMCKLLEDLVQKIATEEKHDSLLEVAKNLLNDGRLSIEDIAKISGLSTDEITKISLSRN